eukprot:s3343_g10.t1
MQNQRRADFQASPALAQPFPFQRELVPLSVLIRIATGTSWVLSEKIRARRVVYEPEMLVRPTDNPARAFAGCVMCPLRQPWLSQGDLAGPVLLATVLDLGFSVALRRLQRQRGRAAGRSVQRSTRRKRCRNGADKWGQR